MRDALAAALAGRAALVFAEDAGAGAVAAVRAAAGESAVVLLVLGESVPELDRAMLIAALAPLAAELAPQTRIAGLDLAAGAEIADVADAALFLADAASTTGQVLRITPR